MSLVWPLHNMPRDKDLWVGDNLVRSESQKRHKRIPRIQHSFQDSSQFAGFRQRFDLKQPLCQMED